MTGPALAALITGLVLLDVGVWTIAYRTFARNAQNRNWRMIESNITVITVNVALTLVFATWLLVEAVQD